MNGQRAISLAVLVASIAAASCATAPPCAQRYVPIGTPQPFLWEVTGPHGGVALLGTLHSASEADVPTEAWRLLDQAAVFVAEADEVGRFDRYSDENEDWRDALTNPPGRSLMRSLSASDFDDLRRRLDADAGELARLKLWVAIGLLMKTVFAFPEPNISAAVLARARARGIATEFFDTWPEQVAFLDATVDAADVRGALHDYPNLGCKLIGQIEAYRGAMTTHSGSTRHHRPIRARRESRSGQRGSRSTSRPAAARS